MTALTRRARYLWYPATMGFAVMLYVLLLADGAPTLVALYAPVLVVATVVLWLQWRCRRHGAPG